MVERAQSDKEYRIYPLNDPTSRIDRYAFDYGWQQFAQNEMDGEDDLFADYGEEE